MSESFPPSEGAFLPQGSPVRPERGKPSEEPVAEALPVELKRGPAAGGRMLLPALLAAVVSAVVAGIVATIISVGVNLWMARPADEPGGRLKQEGKVTVGPNGSRDVFYAEPFAGPPKLELENMAFVTLKEQKADHFTLQTQGMVQEEVRWRAEGMRVPK